MRKIYRRKIMATGCPLVSHASYERERILICSTAQTGQQPYDIVADMSIYTASQLILNLRKALREIRQEKIAALDAQVVHAEKPL